MTVKYCKDCKHILHMENGALCQRPIPSLVYGTKSLIALCESQRKSIDDNCGFSAKFFEPRQPINSFALANE